MAVPDYQTLMRPLLAICNDGEKHSLSELHDQLCVEFNLSTEDIAQKINSGRQTTMKNRIGWARTYMRKAGLLDLPERGYCQITEEGKKVLGEQLERIDIKFLRQYPSFQDFVKPKESSSSAEIIEADSSATPEEQMTLAQNALNQSLSEDIISAILSASPQFFEQLVVDLMLAMGYGGAREDAGEATQYSNDGGIDGIINEDPLGLDTIYLQAKRYTTSTIGRPDIQSFAGALDMQKAKKGVFITASRFSKDAIEFVGMIEKSIVLIDGQKLAELMIKYDLGVAIKQVYAIKQIDSDYFSEE